MLTQEKKDRRDKKIQDLIDNLPKLTEEERQEFNWLGDPIPTEEDIQRIRQATQDIIDSLSNPTPEIMAELRRDCSEVIRLVTSREYSIPGPKTT